MAIKLSGWVVISWCRRDIEAKLFSTEEEARRWICPWCRHLHHIVQVGDD